MNLFIDTSNTKLILILEDKEKIIDSLTLENQMRISDITLSEIEKFLSKNNLDLKKIIGLYATKGPGSYTGVRVAITILKTLKLINNSYDIYLISSLAFQAGIKNSISLLDAKGNKSYMGIYENGENLIADQLIPNELIEEFSNQFKEYEIIRDYENVDFKNSFLKLKKSFIKIKNLEEIEPLYIKHFI